MAGPDRAMALQTLIEPLTHACALAEQYEDFVLAAKLSDCVEWILASRPGCADDGGSRR